LPVSRHSSPAAGERAENESAAEGMMRTLLQDMRYARRMLTKSPGFTIIAILTLALGIGANTAIFSVVYGVVLKPLPYQRPAQLVRVYSEFPTFPNGGLRRFWISAPEYLELQRDTHSWATLDAWVEAGANLTGTVNPIRVNTAYVTGGLLETLDVAPMLGRTITPADDKPGATLVTDISSGLWRRAFGGDPGVIGRDVQFNGAKITIVGVMPAGFEFPPGENTPPDLWVPLQIDPAKPGSFSSHFLYLLGRLKPGATLLGARTEMASLVVHYGEITAAKAHNFRPKRHTIVMYPLQEEVTRTVRPALLMLLGAVFFVLLIACVNVANLLLARAEIRQREIAVRTAMGATVGRLARQFIVEGTVLALLGAAVGLFFAYGGLRLIILTNAGMIPRVGEISLNANALLFTLAMSIATGIFFGLAPLAHAGVRDLHGALKSAAGRTTSSVAAQWFRRALVVGEVALALVLLVGSGLMVRGFWKLLAVNPGFDSHGLLTMHLALSPTEYPKPQDQTAIDARLLEALNAVPGVQSAAFVSGLPPDRPLNANDTSIENYPMGPNTPIQNVDFWNTVTPSYFTVMKTKLLAGRYLNDGDGANAPPVVVINQSMARHFWGNQDPIGKRVLGDKDNPWRTIVGVIADVKNAGLDQPAGTELFFPYQQAPPFGFGLQNFYAVLRTSGDPASLVRDAREAINKIDPALPVSAVSTMDDVLTENQSRPRFLTLLLGLFSGLALLLSAVGIYGLMAYSVTQRTNEIGIRMALGAQPQHVMRMILGQGMKLALVGMAVGLALAFGLTRLMSSLLFGVTPTDPATFIAVVAVLAGAVAAACYIPARRAMRVDPMVALRYE
jgi:putative ABC transport system permease protein